jgi:cation transport ATPase
MKNIILMLLLCSKIGYAQFIKADLMASGLTCSMCNLATQKQLQSLHFIDTIIPDLELNAFHIYFNKTQKIDFSQIRKKVEDAGFFIAELKVTYKNTDTYRYSKPLLFAEDAVFYIDQFDDKKEWQEFKLIDEGFVTAKENKKYKKIKKEMMLAADSSEILPLSNIKIYYVLAQ